MTDTIEGRGGARWPWEIALGVLLLAFFLIWFRPLTPWEFDETLFTLSVTEWNPRAHQPPPPGYPLLIGVAGLVAPLVSSPFEALVAMSIAGSLLGLIALARAFALLGGSTAAGLAGALIFYLSPTMLVHGSLGMSDPPALAFLAAALLWAFRLAERRTGHTLPDLLIFAAASAAAIGFRPQFAIALLPLFAFVVGWVRPWKSRAIVLATFTAVCLLWIGPLVASFGGIAPLLEWERGQAAWFARHDAALSRGRYGAFMVAVRFLAHPWGMKWLALPVLALALAGGTRLILRRERLLVPLALLGVPYVIFALLTMDPADAVRYAIPFSIVVAGLAGVGATFLLPWMGSRLALVAVLVWGGFAFAYVQPILSARRDTPSPPVSAAEWARSALPPSAVLLVDPPLMPHARLLLRSFQTAPIDEGLNRFSSDAGTPLWIFADGYSPRADAAKFWWPRSDAYGKTTRGSYRVVSLIPVPPAERFIPLEGVEPLEFAGDGTSWRWLQKEASLVVPRLGSSRVEFRFLLPKGAPHELVNLSLFIEGELRAGLPVQRGSVSTARLRMPEGGLLTVVSDKPFIPADHAGRVERELGVMLVGVRQIP